MSVGNADPDGDGFGWENNASCVVPGSTAEIDVADAPDPFCSNEDADPDGDGWGWENNASCIAVATEDNDAATTEPETNSEPATDSEPETEAIDINDAEPTVRNDTELTGSIDSEPVDNDDSESTDNSETTGNNGSELTDGAGNEPTSSDEAEPAISDDAEPTIGDEAELADNIDSEPADSPETKAANIDGQKDTDSDIPAYLPSDITDLILVTGQSNTLGSNTTVDSFLDSAHPRVFAYTDKGWKVAELYQSWDNGPHPGTGNPKDVEKKHNNFALHFGKRLAELDETKVVGFVLVSEPGEGIEHWAPGNTGMLRVQQKTLDAINSLPHKTSVDGILWHQGETDWQAEGTSDPDVAQPALVNYYPLSLSALIANLRSESWFDNNQPFICGETIQAFLNVHLRALNSDGDTATACVEGEGLPAVQEGGSHFNADALRTIGRRYAELYNAMQ